MNILVLTSVYKVESLGNEDKSTNVVNSFAREWVKQGHKVIVIHNAHRYPRFIHRLPRKLREKLAVKLGFFIGGIIPEAHYDDLGVDVWRLPVLKYIPHRGISRRSAAKQAEKIEKILKEADFVPEVITGHWASPQMEIISELKKTFSCRTAVVLHGTDYVDQPHFMNKDYLKYIDKLGCRSKTQAEIIQKLLSMHELPFVCYSGVPDEYLEKFKLNIDKFDNIAKWKFTYVGRLVGYKRVDIIIQALNKIDFEWELNIVGDGAERKKLENLCSDLQCTDKVKFHGKIARDQVMDLLKETHCFVMVSKGEVFGLVYLEAMAASCITIGSIGEGIDGIIIDGQNGYLCEAANLDSLVMKLKEMLCNPDLQKVATEGYKTAGEFSDSSVAMDYLRKITGYYYLGN